MHSSGYNRILRIGSPKLFRMKTWARRASRIVLPRGGAIDAEYNQDPGYLNDLLLHRLTLEAQKAVESSDLSKRELIRRLGTSASQFYRLLDSTYSKKSVGQMLALLHLLGRDVDVVVSPQRNRPEQIKRRRRGRGKMSGKGPG